MTILFLIQKIGFFYQKTLILQTLNQHFVFFICHLIKFFICEEAWIFV